MMKRFSLLFTAVLVVILIGCSGGDDPVTPTIDPPNGLTATALSADAVKLTWTDVTLLETGFSIERKGGATVDWSEIATASENANTYTDNNVDEGQTLSYRVFAIGRNSESDPSNEASVTTPPLGPDDLAANQDANDLTAINIVWTDLSDVETGYEIARSNAEAGEYVTIATIAADLETYQDAGLAEKKRFYYRVRSVMDTLYSPWSEIVNARTEVLTPTAPTQLMASSDVYDEVVVTWTNTDENNQDSIEVRRSIADESSWETLAMIAGNRRQYNDEDVLDETIYYYGVRSWNVHGSSGWTESDSSMTPKGPPPVPTQFDTLAVSYNSVTLTWTDNSDDEIRFEIFRHPMNNNNWIPWGSVGTDVNVFMDDSSVAMNTTYFYAVRAVNEAGWSNRTSELEVTTKNGPPLAPRSIEAETISYEEVAISWIPGSTNETGFVLMRLDSSGGNDRFTNLAFPDRGVTSYIDTEVQPETMYWYKVKARNDVGVSAESPVDSALAGSLIVFSDDFEDKVVGLMGAVGDWDTQMDGSATVKIQSEESNSPTKAVELADPLPGDVAILVWNGDNIFHAEISLWLKIAANGAFGIQAADNNNTGPYITWRVQFNADNSYYVQNVGNIEVGGNSFPTGEWFNLKIVQDAVANEYDILFNDEAVNVGLGHAIGDGRPTDWFRFICFSDNQIDYVYIDDVSIEVIIEEGAPELSDQGQSRSLSATSTIDKAANLSTTTIQADR